MELGTLFTVNKTAHYQRERNAWNNKRKYIIYYNNESKIKVARPGTKRAQERLLGAPPREIRLVSLKVRRWICLRRGECFYASPSVTCCWGCGAPERQVSLSPETPGILSHDLSLKALICRSAIRPHLCLREGYETGARSQP